MEPRKIERLSRGLASAVGRGTPALGAARTGGIERVGPVDALAVTADLDHLRAASVGVAVWMGRVARDAPDPNGAGELGFPRFGDVVLTHLARSPTGDVEELVVEREVDVADQRRHGASRTFFSICPFSQ